MIQYLLVSLPKSLLLLVFKYVCCICSDGYLGMTQKCWESKDFKLEKYIHFILTFSSGLNCVE